MADGADPGAVLARLIHREGPVPFDTFVEAALYGPGGFFASGRGAGHAAGGSDFITGPEVGPVFGALVGVALDRWWDALDRPDPYLVVEAGAGRGRLASDVARAEPRCLAALRYVLVERSAVLRDAQRSLLRLEPSDEALGPYMSSAGSDAPMPVPASGPVITSLDDLPGVEFEGVVLANELLDNLPFGIARWNGSAWDEIRVGLDTAGKFIEVIVPALPSDGIALERVTSTCTPVTGDRLPIPRGVDDWFRRVATTLRRGYVVLVDTMDTAAGMLARRPDGWLRTYRGHAPAGAALDEPGSRDLVSDVMIEQLHHAAADAGFSVLTDTTQAEWLDDLGLAAMVDEGRRLWDERAAVGDLAALEARSRATQAAALTDATGLGSHRVVVLSKRIS